MNDLEDRLRTDLTAAVETAAPPLPQRSSIMATVDRRRRRRHATLLSAAAVLAIGFGLVASQAMTSDDNSDPVMSSTTETTSAPTTSSTAPSTTSTTSTPAPTGEDEPAALGTDALLGVAFGEDPDTAAQQIMQAADGTIIDDSTQNAAADGASGFACHGPNGPSVQELRRVVIEAADVRLYLYIADGVYMGYTATGSNPRYVTDEGVGLGSSEDDLVAAYGDRLDIGPGISEPQIWASLEIPDAILPVVFEYNDGDPVNNIVVGARCSD